MNKTYTTVAGDAETTPPYIHVNKDGDYYIRKFNPESGKKDTEYFLRLNPEVGPRWLADHYALVEDQVYKLKG